LVEGAETLTLTLFDTGSYDVGSAASATVTIDDNDAANLAPTAVVLSNAVPALSEATSTASAIRVADISIVDDGLGANSLSLSGTDAAFFQITGSSLYLKAGTSLSHVTKPSYNVTVNVNDPTVGGNPDAFANFTLTITAAVAPGTIVISEVASWGNSNSPLAADWFEVTNTGRTPVDVTGWKMDDNSHAIGTAVPLNGITSIAPGEAVIFIETADPATAAAGFRSLWFGSHPPAGLQIGSYSGSGVGLSGSGDEVTLFDAAGNLVAGVGFTAAPTTPLFTTFDNHNGVGGTTIPLPAFSTQSAVGVNGAFSAANDPNEIGSPGIGNVGRLIISEVAAWGSGVSSYAADWFEVTNVGSASVDMTGWQMDDNSNGSAKVSLLGVASVSPRQSVVFVELATPSITTTVPAFEAAWFGSHIPSGFTIGTYSGSGVGLSTSTDAVNVFDSSGNRITGVSFGASSTTNFTFDNTAGLGSPALPLPAISTLSVAGVNGAFVAADGVEAGSPGLAFLEPFAPKASPTQSPAANGAGWNNTDATVTWNWSDNPGGSGIDNANCTTTTTSVGEGTLLLNAPCKDLSGNMGNGSYTVKVDKTNPTVTASAKKVDNSDYTFGTWSNQTVTVHYNCSDSGSGIHSCSPDGVFGLDGDVTTSGTATDNADRTGTTGALLVRIDGTAPTAAPTASPAPNGSGWNSGDVTVNWNWTDNSDGSGIDNANCTTSTLSSAEGTLTLNATCKDVAGNTGNASFTVKVDKTDPTVTASATKADGTPYAFGTWTNQAVTVHYTCTDLGSGIATCSGDAVFGMNGVSSAGGSATDNAGRSGSTGALLIKIDRTAPRISIISPAGGPFLNTARLPIYWTARDAASGIASQSAELDGHPVTKGRAIDLFFRPLGRHTLVVNVTDSAGNTASDSESFSIIVTVSSTMSSIDRLLATDDITSASVANSLKSKLSGNENQLRAFLNELYAQHGRKIDEQAYNLLKDAALYLITHPSHDHHEKPGRGGSDDDDSRDHHDSPKPDRDETEHHNSQDTHYSLNEVSYPWR
jgi:hypothetical protein